MKTLRALGHGAYLALDVSLSVLFVLAGTIVFFLREVDLRLAAHGRAQSLVRVLFLSGLIWLGWQAGLFGVVVNMLGWLGLGILVAIAVLSAIFTVLLVKYRLRDAWRLRTDWYNDGFVAGVGGVAPAEMGEWYVPAYPILVSKSPPAPSDWDGPVYRIDKVDGLLERYDQGCRARRVRVGEVIEASTRYGPHGEAVLTVLRAARDEVTLAQIQAAAGDKAPKRVLAPSDQPLGKRIELAAEQIFIRRAWQEQPGAIYVDQNDHQYSSYWLSDASWLAAKRIVIDAALMAGAPHIFASAEQASVQQAWARLMNTSLVGIASAA